MSFSPKKSNNNEEIIITGQELSQWLPHQGNALCLDSVLYKNSNPNQIIGYWNPGNFYFNGHFKVLPGHWGEESSALAGGILAQLAFSDLEGKFPLRESITVKSLAPIKPGTDLIHLVALEKRDGRSLYFSFRTLIVSSGMVATEGTFSGKAVSKKLLCRLLSMA